MSTSRFLIGYVTAESSGQSKLAQLVSNHILSNKHGNMLTAVMHLKRQTNKYRRDHGTTRPCFDRALIIGFNGFCTLFISANLQMDLFLNYAARSIS